MSSIYNVSENFQISKFIDLLVQRYQGKGYNVLTTQLSDNGYVITLNKNTGGINTVLGLGEGIKVNCFINDKLLNINFTDAEWTSKIIGGILGWFLCLIPLITAIIGTVRQFSLPNDINTDCGIIISMLNK